MKRLLFIFMGCMAYAKLELIAITHKQCPVCTRWHEEVYPSYTKTASARHYPKVKVLDIGEPEGIDFVVQKLGYITVIPYFVLVDGDTVGNTFEGYVDSKTFYQDLDKALKSAPRDGLEPPTK